MTTIKLYWDDTADPHGSVGWTAENEEGEAHPVGPNVYKEFAALAELEDFDLWDAVQTLQESTKDEAVAEIKADYGDDVEIVEE